MIGSGLLGILYGPVSRLGIGYFCALRVLQGLVQSGQFPAQTSLWGKWSPTEERTTLMASNAIATFGVLISNSITPIICQSIGWESVFYIYGSLAILWGICWVLYARNTPAECPWMSSTELNFIQQDLNQGGKKPMVKWKQIPWKDVLTNSTVIGFITSIYYYLHN